MSLFSHACGATGPVVLDITGPWSGRHTVAGPTVRIGRHPGANVVLDHPEVGRRQAYLQVIGGRLFRLDLGAQPETPMGWIDPAKPFPVGPFRIRAQIGDGPFPDASAAPDDLPSPLSAAYARLCDYPAAALAIDDGHGALTMYPVTRVLTLIGRAPACKIRLEGRDASLYYGGLLRTPIGLWFVDLLSSAGVAVNGRRAARARLRAGDALQVGRYVMTVRPADPDEASRGRPADSLPAPLPAGIGASPQLRPVREPTAEEIQPLLRELADMHERTCEQFREVILVLTQLFGSMQADQTRAVREQTEEIRALAGAIGTLGATPMGAPQAPAAIAADGDAGPDAEGGSEAAWSRPDPREVESLIGERLAFYEAERERRWSKLLRTLAGR